MQTDASDKVWLAVPRSDLNDVYGYHRGTFSKSKETYNNMEKEILAVVRGIEVVTTFVKQVLDNDPHMHKVHRCRTFLS